jgi:hypothetical protein
METRFKRWLDRSKREARSQADQALAHSCAGRVINTLRYLAILLCLGLWITAFVLLKDQLFSSELTGAILTNLTCLTFFGGLVAAVLIGALVGNFLHRQFWNILTRQKDRNR